MTAKEMFEELGYKEIKSDNEYNIICYERYTPKRDKEEIVFHRNKHFATFLNGKFSYVFIKELKAINKQIEELGW